MKKTSKTFFLLTTVIIMSCSGKNEPVDRKSLVARHNVTNTSSDSLNSLTLGNGKFAFTADITGLQTFPDHYMHGIPLGTMSEWGWHTSENQAGFGLQDVYKSYEVNGRQVPYVHQFSAADDKRKSEASDWLRANPLRIYLGFTGLQVLKHDGNEITIADVTANAQTLDLWKGELISTFIVEGTTVKVITVCHPEKDMISARIESELIKDHRLRLRLKFPSTNPVGFGMNLNMTGDEITEVISTAKDNYLIERDLRTEKYFVNLLTTPGKMIGDQDGTYIIEPDADKGFFEFSCLFSPSDTGELTVPFEETRKASGLAWENFWTSGGAVDFSECTDPRAFELERRVILSQYLTQAQCRGQYPPAETGLTYNSWFGKFHLEMHWWHAVHFALWQREETLIKQMEYYFSIMDNASKTAVNQGYEGVRWPKMTDRDGRESPSTVGTYLIWQQPHPIFFAELLYENSDDPESVLLKYKDLVSETADFMASYAFINSQTSLYQLGPVLIPAQESLARETTINPVFELVYWKWGLTTAARWKKRLGEEVPGKWSEVLDKFPPLPVKDGLYLCSQDTKDSYVNERYMRDHPIVSGILGVMPETGLVDRNILAVTLDTISKKWNWHSTWGWDFPMLAMAAAEIGRGEQAIGFLMMDAPKNRYLLNGHNYQDARLALYLPGNGGLLTAVAKMCVENQFPDDGKWKVKWEDLNHYVE